MFMHTLINHWPCFLFSQRYIKNKGNKCLKTFAQRLAPVKAATPVQVLLPLDKATLGFPSFFQQLAVKLPVSAHSQKILGAEVKAPSFNLSHVHSDIFS